MRLEVENMIFKPKHTVYYTNGNIRILLSPVQTWRGEYTDSGSINLYYCDIQLCLNEEIFTGLFDKVLSD